MDISVGLIVKSSDATFTAAGFQLRGRSLARKSVARVGDFFADKTGAIAVETALVAPFILFGILVGGSLSLSVYNHQKVYTGAYSGASYLHDKVAAGDLSGLKSTQDENGNKQPGDWITTAKLIIKDASGLPLDLNEIDIDTFCACPAVSPGEFENSEDTDELANRTTFYVRTELVESENDEICPTNCADGDESRIIAEIIIDYQAASLKGGIDPIREKLVTRLR